MNIRDAKYVHFQELNYDQNGMIVKKDHFPILTDVPDSIVEIAKERSVHLDKNYNLRKKIFGICSGALFYVYALAA